MTNALRLFYTALVCPIAWAQQVEVREATPHYMPAPVDCNSPAFWRDGEMHVLNSANMPLLSRGQNQFLLETTDAVDVSQQYNVPVWIEAAHQEEDGTLLFWYHHEPGGICPGSTLTAPVIGAAVSYDGGKSMIDLGIVMQTGDAPDCGAKNGFFASGHGDFSVILDREGQYFYFFFGNYGGDEKSQGVAVARLAYADRFNPVGSVQKWFEGEWTEPGLGGRVSPVFPVKVSWARENADAFWGPSIHWNTALQQHVILMNHTCCAPQWPQEGIYVSFGADLANPGSWSEPKRILSDEQIGFGPGFYPQILGLQRGETDTLAGQAARLYIHGVSLWELHFRP